MNEVAKEEIDGIYYVLKRVDGLYAYCYDLTTIEFASNITQATFFRSLDRLNKKVEFCRKHGQCFYIRMFPIQIKLTQLKIMEEL